MKNMGSIIFFDNKQTLQPDDYNFGCTCRIKGECPLENKCLKTNIVYEATVTNNGNDNQKDIQELLKHHLKKDSETNARDFKHQKYESVREPSKYNWRLKIQKLLQQLNREL